MFKYLIFCNLTQVFLLHLFSFTNLFRDLSFNALTSFPTEGLSGLNQLKLVGNTELREALTAKDFMKLR